MWWWRRLLCCGCGEGGGGAGEAVLSGLSVAGSEGTGAGGADAMDGDSEGWEPVAGGGTFWTGIEGSVAVVVMCWIGGVGSDGVCCGSGGWTGGEALMVCGGYGWGGGCVTGGKAE